MKLFFKSLCFTVVLLGASSCTNPEKEAKKINQSLNAEAKTYLQLEYKNSPDTQNKIQGESVTDALQKWAVSLSVLSSQMKSLEKALGKADQEKLKNAEDDITKIKGKIESVLNRDYSLSLYIPTWEYDDALSFVVKAHGHLFDISSVYGNVFLDSSSRVSPPALNFNLYKDKEVFSTLESCRKTVEIVLKPKVRNLDVSCVDIAVHSCGHQLDGDCVHDALNKFADSLPSKIQVTETEIRGCSLYQWIREDFDDNSFSDVEPVQEEGTLSLLNKGYWSDQGTSFLGRELSNSIKSCYKTPVFGW